MKYYLKIILILGMASCTTLQGQNLIPNYSFEEIINFRGEKTSGWHKVQFSDTPDYFNINSNYSGHSAYEKYYGGIKPKTGEGFIGIFCYRYNPERQIRNLREFVQTELLEPLVTDSIYRIEISLCLEPESNVVIKNFGIYFNDEFLADYKEYKLLTIEPQVEFVLSSTDSRNNWITFSSFYKASGNEKFIMLGNFRSDKKTSLYKLASINDKTYKKKWDLVKGEKASYFYIDDIIVEKVTLEKKETIESFNNSSSPLVPDTISIADIPIDSAVILKNIFFEFNKADLLPASENELQKLYSLLVSHLSVRIRIEGHTDNLGGYDFNLDLSKRRAESVVLYLLNRGIAADRIESAGYSYVFPIASNETPEGRQINRRVTFKILNK